MFTAGFIKTAIRRSTVVNAIKKLDRRQKAMWRKAKAAGNDQVSSNYYVSKAREYFDRGMIMEHRKLMRDDRARKLALNATAGPTDYKFRVPPPWSKPLPRKKKSKKGRR